MDLPPEARRWDKPDPLPLQRVMAGFLVPRTLAVVSLQDWQDPTDPMPLEAMEKGVLPENPGFDKEGADDSRVKNNREKVLRLIEGGDRSPAFAAYLKRPGYDYKVSQFYWAAHQTAGIKDVRSMGVDLDSPEASWFLARIRPFLSPVANGAGILATEDIPLKWLPEEAEGYGLEARCFGHAPGDPHVMCQSPPKAGKYYCAACLATDEATRDFILNFDPPAEFGGDAEALAAPDFPGMYKNARFLGYYRGQLLMWKEKDGGAAGTGWAPDGDRFPDTMELEKDDYKIILEDLVYPGAYVDLAGARSTSRMSFADHVNKVKNTEKAAGIVMGGTWSNWTPFVNDLFMGETRTKRPHLLYTSTSMVWQIRPIKKGEELDVDYGEAYVTGMLNVTGGGSSVSS